MSGCLVNCTTHTSILSLPLFPPSLHLTALMKKPKDLNVRAADMWSFAVTLWEMATREVPFADLTPMEAGMKVGDIQDLSEGGRD